MGVSVGGLYGGGDAGGGVVCRGASGCCVSARGVGWVVMGGADGGGGGMRIGWDLAGGGRAGGW